MTLGGNLGATSMYHRTCCKQVRNRRTYVRCIRVRLAIVYASGSREQARAAQVECVFLQEIQTRKSEKYSGSPSSSARYARQLRRRRKKRTVDRFSTVLRNEKDSSLLRKGAAFSMRERLRVRSVRRLRQKGEITREDLNERRIRREFVL